MQYILVTGANGGMGRAVTELFASRGFRVFALDRDACEPRENIIPVRADVTDEESVAAAFDVISGTAHSSVGYRRKALSDIPPEKSGVRLFHQPQPAADNAGYAAKGREIFHNQKNTIVLEGD